MVNFSESLAPLAAVQKRSSTADFGAPGGHKYVPPGPQRTRQIMFTRTLGWMPESGKTGTCKGLAYTEAEEDAYMSCG